MIQAIQKLVIVAFFFTLFTYLFGVDSAHAEPYFAVREGYKCSQCHVNRTGGGKRNGFGVIYSQTVLPHLILKDPKQEKGFLLDPNLNDYISIGADLRVQNTTILLEEKNSEGKEEENGFTISEGNLYIEARLLGDYISLYFDETFAPSGAISREAFGMIQNLPWNAYLKAGKFLLPYGLRLQDDASFIREVMGFTYSTPDLGVELGMEPGPFSIHAAFTNGTQGGAESNVEKQVSVVGALVFRHFRIGGSFINNESPTTVRYGGGGFAGINVGRITLLGEADWLQDLDKEAEEVTRQFVAYGELDFLIWKGINMKFSYDFHDPDLDIDENERERISVGVEPFITQFFQFRIFYRDYNGIPQKPGDNNQEIMAEVHFFF